MRGVLINPYTKSVNEVQIEFGLGRVLSWLDHNVVAVEMVGEMRSGDTLILDLHRVSRSHKRYFRISGQVFCGCGILLHLGADGKARDAKSSLVETQVAIEFLGENHV